MSDHAATAWSPELLPVFIGPPWSCCSSSCSNCMIMLKLHWLTHLFTKLGGAMLCGYSLDQLCWFGPRIHEHAQPRDLQLRITVTDWLIPRPLYVSQSSNTQVWYTKIPGGSIGILRLFSPLTLLGARMCIITQNLYGLEHENKHENAPILCECVQNGNTPWEKSPQQLYTEPLHI